MSLDPFNPFNPDIPSDNNDIVVNEFMQPPFETWVKNKLSHIFDADNQEEFDSSFDDLVSEQDGDLIFKGEKQSSRDQFKQKLWGEVKFNKGDVTEVDITKFPSEGEKHLTGSAEVKFEVSGNTYTLNLRIIEDQELVPPMIPMSGRPGFIDRRRATDLTLT